MPRKSAPRVRTAPMQLTAASPARPAVVVPPPAPSEDEIRALAYRKWDEAGRPEGDGSDFWFAAEHELRR